MPLKAYEKILKKWDSSWGTRPTAAQLNTIIDAGFAREGSKTAFALAMLLRENGASQVQIKEALGATYRNRAAQLQDRGLIKLQTVKHNGQMFYRIAIIATERLERRQSSVAEQHASQ